MIDLNDDLAAFVRALRAHVPAFAHLRASRILFVAAEARRRSFATIRGTVFNETGTRLSRSGQKKRPVIMVNGRRIRYWISLRPLFFRGASPGERLETIVHELFHIALSFDGSLARDRRHRVVPRSAYRRLIAPLVAAARPYCPRSLQANASVTIAQWLVRPPLLIRVGERRRVRFDERHIFRARVEMVTR